MVSDTRAWVTLENTLAIYNLSKNTLISMIPVGVLPSFPRLTPEGTRVLVPNQGSNTVSVVCTTENLVLSTISVGLAPTAVAIDATGTTAYVTNSGSGTVSVISLPTNTVVSTITVGLGPSDVAIDRDGNRIYVSNRDDNTISVINPVTNLVSATISAGTSPHGLALSPDNEKLFVVNSDSHTISVINTSTNTPLTLIPIGSKPEKVVVNPMNPAFLYVSCPDDNIVSVLSTTSLNVVAHITVGAKPLGLAVSEDGAQLWVANEGDRSISVIDTLTHTITASLPTTFHPRGITLGSTVCALSLEDTYPKDSVCILAEKVYASCLQREGFPNILVSLPSHRIPPFTFESITFSTGLIVPESVVMTPIPARPNFSRVQFSLEIPYSLSLRDSTGTLFTLPGNLPAINKDLVLYVPQTRPEFEFNLRVETRTELLTPPLLTSDSIKISMGSFIITKVTGQVQLLIPTYGSCPEPPVCEAFSDNPKNPCADFLDETLTPFPKDFFPSQADTFY